MASLGKAVIEVGADASGFKKDVEGQVVPPAGSAGSKAGKSLGTRMGSVLKKTMKVSAIATGAVITGAIGLSLVKGFDRLKGIENAKAKLKGLGHSAEDVAGIMKNALVGVKGTAFGLEDAASIAASAVASGIKPGKDLERTLKLTGDAATIAGTGLGEMGAIFNKVAATGKLQGEVLAQLGERGIPILQLLGEELGKTPEEVRKLSAAGKIGFEEFQDAIEKGMGGAALESGKTFSGALANVQAAMGRLGASLLGGVFEKLPSAFGKLNAGIDTLGPFAEKAGKAIGSAFAGIGQAASDMLSQIDFGAIADKAKAVAGTISKFLGSKLFAAFIGSVKSLASSVGSALGTVIPAVGKVVKAFTPIVGGVIAAGIAGLTVAFYALGPVIEVVASTLSVLMDIISNPVVATFLSLILAVVVGMKAYKLIMITAAAVTKAYAATMLIVKNALSVAQTVQWAFNAAIAANPIGAIIVAVIAFVAVIVLLWKKSETFQKVVKKVWAGIKKAIGATVDWFSKNVLPVFQKVFDGVVSAVTFVVDFIRDHWKLIIAIFMGPLGIIIALVETYFDQIKDVITAVFEVVFAVLRVAWEVVYTIFIVAMAIIFTIVDVAFTTLKNIVMAVFEFLSPYIQAAWDVISGIFSAVLDVIIGVVQTAWDAISTVFTTALDIIKTIITTVFNVYKTIIMTVFTAIKGVVQRGIDAVKSVISRVTGTIKSIWSKAWGSIKSKAEEIWGQIEGFFSGAIDTLGGIFGSIADAISGPFKSAFNGIASAWNSTVGSLSFEIPKWVPGMGGKGWSVPNIPQFADGVRNFSGGLALVGEEGPEIVNLPRGADVFSNPESRAMAGQSGGTTYGDIFVTVSVDDLDKMVKMGDFLDMLDRARVDSRKTARSGTVSA